MVIQYADVITIMERTLNHIDTRLVNHGRRVAHIVYRILQASGRYDDREVRDICLTALLHDIGAYKTEEIDKMVRFETQQTWDHSIYGYLFLKHFSPLAHLAWPVLHHHTRCTGLDRDHPLTELAQYIFIADRIDVYTGYGINDRDELNRVMQKQRDVLFFGDILDFVLDSVTDLPVLDEHVSGDSEISRVLHTIPLRHDEVVAYLKMIVLFIDFRSHHTLNHTIVTTSISDTLADLLGVYGPSRSSLVAGSWLHDIGKTGIPLSILEKPGRLTDEEMSIIQQHVRITDEILCGCVPHEVRRIAARHHEKLDGSGYPLGLHGADLSICERIAVVSDIFSALCGVRSYKDAFPKQRVVCILAEMRDQGLLDPAVVDVAVDCFDTIMRRVGQETLPFDQSFLEIRLEHARLQTEMLEKIWIETE